MDDERLKRGGSVLSERHTGPLPIPRGGRSTSRRQRVDPHLDWRARCDCDAPAPARPMCGHPGGPSRRS